MRKGDSQISVQNIDAAVEKIAEAFSTIVVARDGESALDGAVDEFVFGANVAGVEVSRTANQSIPDSTVLYSNIVDTAAFKQATHQYHPLTNLSDQKADEDSSRLC